MRSRAMRTSLVITTFDRADALALVLRSVAAQRTLPDEVLVADDGSGPDTAATVARLAAGFPVPLRHSWQEDRGFRLAASRNRALALATGEYVVMVDGDLLLHPCFVQDHLRAARPGQYLQGSRVLLSEPLTRRALAQGRFRFGPLTAGLSNRENALRLPALARLVSPYSTDVLRARGASMSFWRADVLSVNGFNEDFEGWGREDSEFAARMDNAGLRRLRLKFAAVGYHLWHPEAPRASLPRNQLLLDITVARRVVRCERGIDQYLRPAGQDRFDEVRSGGTAGGQSV